jgi:hypothetical protein
MLPKDAVITALMSRSVSVDETVNCADVWPEEIAIQAGTDTIAVLLESWIVAFEVSAALSLTVQLEEFPALNVAGLQVTLDS